MIKSIHKKKVLFIISGINKSQNLEWFFELISKDDKIFINCILLGQANTSFEKEIKSHGFEVKSYNQLKKVDLLFNFFYVSLEILRLKPDIIHCHLRDATIIGIISAFIMRIKKRVYTRHNSSFNHLYYPKSVWIDKLINKLSTDVISISKNVTNVLSKEGVPLKKIHLIHHGFKISEFESISIERISNIKAKYGIKSYPVIGVISRYLHLKGYQYIIPALAKVKRKYSDAQFVFANSSGSYNKQIQRLIHQYDISNNLIEIPFEEDVIALFKTFDLFIHTPINDEIEAFGQIYVESQLLGVPSIVTMSGVAPEFIKHRENAFVVPHKNSTSIVEAIEELLENNVLKDEIAKNGRENISGKFTIEEMVNNHVKLYLND